MAELGERMSSRELTEWMAYYVIEPFGPEVDDLRHAQAMTLHANVNREQGRRAFTLADFRMGDSGTVEPDPESLAAKFDALTSM